MNALSFFFADIITVTISTIISITTVTCCLLLAACCLLLVGLSKSGCYYVELLSV